MKIRPLSKRQEKQILAAMLASLNELPDNGFFPRFKREIIGFGVAMLLVAVVLGVLRSQSLLAAFTTAGGSVVGLGIGIGAWRLTAAQHWPVVARCLDRDKIEGRLRELDA